MTARAPDGEGGVPAPDPGLPAGSRAMLAAIFAASAVVAVLLLLVFVPWNVSPVRTESDAEFLVRLSREVPHLPVPLREAEAFGAIVDARLRCYRDSASLGDRIRGCARRYTRDVLVFAHQSARTNAGLSEFVGRVSACPALFNICRGEGGGTADVCVTRELECLNFALDGYRYGSRTARSFQ
ncbi:hypothetical protein ABIE65_003192 [Constrictibacter sp. MBR-5]|jgi:hypothetical protein|uniref:hypothetical protein n=1 Tax=Constrictibacter sp. MBR-5 TaxID=3156467 RepID=UPI00339B1900